MVKTAGAQQPNPRMQPDRFAREILAILERDTMRSRRLMREALGRPSMTLTLCVRKSGMMKFGRQLSYSFECLR